LNAIISKRFHSLATMTSFQCLQVWLSDSNNDVTSSYVNFVQKHGLRNVNWLELLW